MAFHAKKFHGIQLLTRTPASVARLELLHKNVKIYGTVFNTVSAGTVLSGTMQRA
jgi:hypothetical protein